ncbi:hypothetical protein BGZ83_004845 [Gryganskiella cystojenkinii]|nr:hypothetical protein BGZ83_004845 [Gryganskiella cystojenkinii]
MPLFVRRPPTQAQRQQQQRPLGRSSNPGTPHVAPVKRIIEKPAYQPIPGTYTDYKLRSTSKDVLHHVMRFHGRKAVNPATFNGPVKLHRKRNENQGYYRSYNFYNANYRPSFNASLNKEEAAAAAAAAAAGGATAGAAGSVEEKKPATGADTALIAPYGGGVRNKQMLFKKRTRQIYLANEDERKKKEIESAPWVVEEDDGQNSFTGQLEGGQHADYVLFVFTDDGFKVVPADKWYKFSSKIQYATLTAEEAEEQYTKSQKQNNSIRWLMRSKKAKTEDGEEGGEDEAEGEQFMAVDHDDDAGYDEDEAKERKRKRGKHGDADEMDFDEDFQDDEEAPADMPGFDDDAKDDPRRKQGPSMDSDEDEDEEEKKGLTETGKVIKKALLKLEKNKVYASDDEKDPYASDQDSSDSDLDEIDKEMEKMKDEESNLRSQETAKGKKKTATNSKNAPLIAKKASATVKPPPKPVSTKATKVKVPMPNPRNASAGLQPNGKGAVSSAAASSSTLSSAAARAHSPTPPTGARSSSPSAATTGRASSPGAAPDKKRRKVEGVSGETSEQGRSSSSAVASTSAATTTAAPGDDSMLITESEVVALLKGRPQMTTRDLINDLKRKLRKDARNKGILAQIVKKVASTQDGHLILKDAF